MLCSRDKRVEIFFLNSLFGISGNTIIGELKMTDEIVKIMDFMIDAFVHIWPYLVITIPIAVAVNMSGASKHIKRAFDAGPIAAILLATVVGAFSPFCSCEIGRAHV